MCEVESSETDNSDQRYNRKMAASVTINAVILLLFVAFSSAHQLQDFLDALMPNHTWDDLQKVLPVSYQEWLQSIDKNSSLQQHLLSTIPECTTDLATWATSLKRREMWAFQSEFNCCNVM